MEKYLQYDTSDFSQESSFIRWVKGSSVNGDFDWDKWIAEHPEKQTEVKQARQLVSTMQIQQVEVPVGTQAKVWSEINEAIDHNKPIENRRQILRWLPYAAAAVIGILLMFNIGDTTTTVQTPYASTKSIELPDGSTVELNADSKLTYNKKTWDNNRKVELEGEAFFQVQKGSKFTVLTDRGDIQVLGTSFNVYSRGNLLDVLCKTGKVAVITKSEQTVLTPLEAVSVRGGIHSLISNVPPQQQRSNWQSGTFVYESTDLKDVIAELERQLDIEIAIDQSLTNILYSGSFNKTNKETALSEVFWPLDLQYKIDGSQVTVTK